MEKPTNKSDRNPRQFHLRTLFGVTFTAAIFMVTAVFLREDSRVVFHALTSLHTLIAALSVAGVFVVHATAVGNVRRLAIISIAIFGVALTMPALRLGGDLVLGVSAFVLSFVGIALFSDWGSRGGEHFWYPVACTMGALANVSFVVGHISFRRSVTWGKSICLARRSATLGSCLALFVILPLGLSTELNGVYVGYGLWAAGLLTLAFASWRTPLERRFQVRRTTMNPCERHRTNG